MYILFLFVCVFWFIPAYLVANDARRSGRNPTGWFIIVAIFGIFGVLFYVFDLSTNLAQNINIKVTGDVIDPNTNTKSKFKLDTKSPSKNAAETRFEKKCMDEGYQVQKDTISAQIKKETTTTNKKPRRSISGENNCFRPGKKYLPYRIRNWYLNTPWDIILFSLFLLSLFPIISFIVIYAILFGPI